MDDGAQVTRRGAFSMQVCVPDEWGDDKMKQFAERENPCGTENGWSVRKIGDKALNDYPERQPCAERGGAGFVHVMLDA